MRILSFALCLVESGCESVMGNALRAVEAAGVLHWQAFDRETLHKIHMPFVEGGGFSLPPIRIIAYAIACILSQPYSMSLKRQY